MTLRCLKKEVIQPGWLTGHGPALSRRQRPRKNSSVTCHSSQLCSLGLSKNPLHNGPGAKGREGNNGAACPAPPPQVQKRDPPSPKRKKLRLGSQTLSVQAEHNLQLFGQCQSPLRLTFIRASELGLPHMDIGVRMGRVDTDRERQREEEGERG